MTAVNYGVKEAIARATEFQWHCQRPLRVIYDCMTSSRAYRPQFRYAPDGLPAQQILRSCRPPDCRPDQQAKYLPHRAHASVPAPLHTTGLSRRIKFLKWSYGASIRNTVLNTRAMAVEKWRAATRAATARRTSFLVSRKQMILLRLVLASARRCRQWRKGHSNRSLCFARRDRRRRLGRFAPGCLR